MHMGSSERSDARLVAARGAAALCASMVALGLAGVSGLAVAGCHNVLVRPVAGALGLCWFVLHFPFACRLVLRRWRDSWVLSDAVLTLGALGVVAVTGLVAARF